MPQPALHILLARDMLAHWRRVPSMAPFRVDANGAESNFLHGSLGPDMGLFPGCEKQVSRLVHTHRTGAMVRSLFAHARTEADRAFAWGWLTHVLADVEIHPIVNEFGGALLAAEGVTSPGHAERGRAHVRVELGLDAWYGVRAPELRTTRIRHVFDARRIRFLHSALLATYSVPFSPRRLLRSHRNVTRFYRLYMPLMRAIAADVGASERAGVLRMPHLRALFGRLMDPRSQAAGFLRPVPPAAEMLSRVAAAVDRLRRTFADPAGLPESLPDYDLETGRPIAAARAFAAA